MKYLIKFRKFSLIFILPFLMVMCMTIEDITHPDNPQVNSEIEINVALKLVPENDDNTKMIFAVLAPTSWNIAESAELTFSTNGYTKGDVVNEPLTVVSATDAEPTTAQPWSTALQSEIGLMENLGPVEWVVFESQTTFNITDEEEKLITADVKIKLTTGSQNIKFFMGYFFTGKNRGLHGEYYKSNATAKVMTVTGGSNPMIDYTTVSLTSITPASYGFGDMFAINFESVVGEIETELKGEETIYLQGKAIYADGNDSSIVDVISDKTLMERIGNTRYQKYIYPRDFFNLPDGAEVSEIYFYFTNEDQSVTVRQSSGEDFLITDSCD